MADAPKTLEMRVAELEDKLSKLHISEDEMKAFQKVSAALGSAPTALPQVCHTITAGCIRSCIAQCWTECRGCIISSCITTACQPCAIFNQSFGSFGGGGG